MKTPTAFSLLELLVVVAILAILAGLSVPSIVSVLQGRNIEAAGAMFADSVSLARQEASAASRTVELRIYRLPSGTGTWQAFQLWSTRGTNTEPIARMRKLPQGVALWLPGSPLITNLAANPSFFVSGTTNAALGSGALDYISVQFRASGALDGSVSTNNNFITLVSEHQTNASAPANYASVLINPATAKATIIRP